MKNKNDLPIKIVLPDRYNGKSVTGIGGWAFYNCSSLISVTMGNSVTNIENSLFYNCCKLSSITFNGTIGEWKAISKGMGWGNGIPTSVVHCTDGDVAI